MLSWLRNVSDNYFHLFSYLEKRQMSLFIEMLSYFLVVGWGSCLKLIE